MAGPITQKEIEETKSRGDALGVPFYELTGQNISVEILKEIPEEAANLYQFVPINKQGGILEVGMVNPDDLKAQEALRFIIEKNNLESRIYIITLSAYQEVIKQYRTLRGEVEKALEELEKELGSEKEQIDIKATPEDIAEKIVSEAPVTKIVAVVLRHAIEGRASDIHIEPMEHNVKVRFRVDGTLHTSLFLPKDINSAVVTRIKILSNLKIDEMRVPQDGRFRAIIASRGIDFRVSTFPTSNGEKVVLRVLDPSAGLKTFKDLGVFGRNLNVLEAVIQRPFGMILITGPTGSGKTTTLYAILNKINEEGINIVSLEDPIEYYIEGVSQSQIKPEIGYTFASGLRHILRQDPDVIMVGEIRDEETADLAVHAALTGHIVLSTLHTNDAIGVIPRLVDMGVSAFLLPSSVILAAAQRLVPRLCSQCKKEITAPSSIEKIIDQELAKLTTEQKKLFPEISFEKPYKIFKAQGCKFCGNKGTKGRIGIFEMMAMTPELEQIINEGVSDTKLQKEAQRQGMIEMKHDGIIKVLLGMISFEDMMQTMEQ